MVTRVLRGVAEAWPIVVEFAALGLLAAGIALIFVPAALIVSGGVVIFAIEGTARAEKRRHVGGARTRRKVDA